jgi:hypothetical protein
MRFAPLEFDFSSGIALVKNRRKFPEDRRETN